MAWCREQGFEASLRKAVEYAASNVAGLSLCEGAAEQGLDLLLVLQCLQGRAAGAGSALEEAAAMNEIRRCAWARVLQNSV